MGPRLFRKKDGILFRHEYVARAEKFYEKYGSKTMLLSHFIPVVRSFAPLVAGVGKMPRWQFFIFDAIGDIVWAVATTLVGYWFGSRIKKPRPLHFAHIHLCYLPNIRPHTVAFAR
jgi:membrane-associated protein